MDKTVIWSIVLTLLLSICGYAGDIKGRATCKGARDSRNVIVYIESIEKESEPSEEHAVMDQKNLTFIPHVLPVVKGTTVDFLNSDDVLHNVFTPDKCADKMNLGTWPKGDVRSYTFDEEGCQSVLLCNVHPEMEAWVLVLQNSHFSKTEKDGIYEIKGVPAGKYKLAVWHEKLKASSVEVEVPEEGAVEVDFTLKK
jgi:plastocyanin